MDHTVGLEDIRNGHDCIAALFIRQDDVIAILQGRPQLATLHGREFRLTIARFDLSLEIKCAEPSRNDVIGEHLGQRGFFRASTACPQCQQAAWRTIRWWARKR